MKWVDQLDLDDSISGKKRHASGSKDGGVSTVFAIDTNEWESMYITPNEEYRILQTYQSEEEAKAGHIF